MEKAIRQIVELPGDACAWRVDWYGNINYNKNVLSESKVQLIVSPLVDSVADYSSIKAVNHNDRKIIAVEATSILKFSPQGSYIERALSRQSLEFNRISVVQ